MNNRSSRRNLSWLLALIPLAFFAWYIFAMRTDVPTRILPVYGPRHDTSGQPHLVPPFTFTDQDGRTLTASDFDGKIYVSEFFFTTCQSICPIMNDHLQRLYNDFSSEPRLHILSHTVDPDTDSVPVLKSYAQMRGVNDQRWHFVTGSKKDLYFMARRGYLLDSGIPADHEDDDFVHTQNFALVDWKKRLRGFYDGTDSAEVQRLTRDIKMLLDELSYNEKDPS